MRKLRTIEIKRLSVEEFKKAEKIPLVAVLDNVRSNYNVGSIFRTADAFRLEKVFLCGITGVPPSAEIHKTALGAEDSVEWKYFSSVSKAIDTLHQEDYYVYAAEQASGSIRLEDFYIEKGKKIAVIFGNEVKGVSQEAIDKCEGCIEISQYGTKHSLNVSVAAGIVLYNIAVIIR